MQNEVSRAVVSRYVEGVSLRNLVSEFRMRYSTIKKIIDASGVPVRSRSEAIRLNHALTGNCVAAGRRRRKVTDSQLAEISVLISSGVKQAKIAEKYGISSDAFRRLLKVDGLYVEPAFRSRTLNETFFDEIDNPEKAYFFGLLMSDGCVFSTRQGKDGGFQINLQAGDSDILEKFRMAINSSKQLTDQFHRGVVYSGGYGNHTMPQKCLRIHSERMAKALISHGCVYRKSKIAQYPAWLRDDLHRHFIRGVFDGDGCICLYSLKNSDRKEFSFSIVGSLPLMTKIRDILLESLGASSTVKESPGCYRIHYGGNRRARMFFDYLYGAGGHRLDRKYVKWIYTLSVVEKRTDDHAAKFFQPEFLATVARLYVDEKMSLPAIEKETGASRCKITNALKYQGLTTRSISEAKLLTDARKRLASVSS